MRQCTWNIRSLTEVNKRPVDPSVDKTLSAPGTESLCGPLITASVPRANLSADPLPALSTVWLPKCASFSDGSAQFHFLTSCEWNHSIFSVVWLLSLSSASVPRPTQRVVGSCNLSSLLRRTLLHDCFYNLKSHWWTLAVLKFGSYNLLAVCNVFLLWHTY